MKTKIDIISGFLGSGKTTLIKKLLKEKLHSEKIVIIENEFGEVGIDGNILKESKAEVKEINSGCICCTLVGDFEKTLKEVVTKYKPDRIIIEPSGVGKLSDVIKACSTRQLKDSITINMTITVVDVLKYQVYLANFGEFFENQIKNAKTIILSRTQKVDSKKLESVVDSIHKLNSKAKVITTAWESINTDIIIAVAEQDTLISLEQQIKRAQKVVIKEHSHSKECKCGCNHNHNADEIFEVWSIETPKLYKEEELTEILNVMENNKSYGFILRGKGILQVDKDKWIQFDYVPGEFEVKNISPDYTGRLCIIGTDLNKNEIRKLFHIL
ncbi:GTPase, G3E family [Clostridium cavendishii DSM 21758]|uniref:GTPase, G3E family n=1 Tax=Clostridium cavendishii DSM 21758 TaxID=1121302 RepID=A0A1M6KXX8_9CLOT|nr:GTP-binding protein [Clostridium cavendishii]SHJ63853.1 GTPase, G3E family [Clostridium cavendishii DSM 21758]